MVDWWIIVDWIIDTIPIKAVLIILYGIFIAPMKIIYFYGPELFGFGGWGGRSVEDICHHLAKDSRSEFWSSHPFATNECERMIEQRFQSNIIGLYGFLYFIVFFSILFKISEFIQYKTLHLLFRGDYPYVRRLSSRYRQSPDGKYKHNISHLNGTSSLVHANRHCNKQSQNELYKHSQSRHSSTYKLIYSNDTISPKRRGSGDKEHRHMLSNVRQYLRSRDNVNNVTSLQFDN